MLTVLAINSISVLFAYLSKYKNYKFGLELSFLIIILFLSIRYNYGNDYKSYLEMFKFINSTDNLDLSFDSTQIEPGWKLLNRLFKPLGFFSMVIATTIFQCYAYYVFIKKYVPIKWQWFAVFIYTFSAGFMLMQASMMRQAFAMSIFLLSIDYIYQKKVVHYIACVVIAYTFHQSALLMIPLIILGFCNFKINTKWIISILLFFISTILFQQFFADKIILLTASQFNKYEYYIESKAEINSGVGIIFQFGLFLAILFNEKKQRMDKSILYKISALSFILIPFAFIVALITRIGMYFSIFTIVVYPLIAEGIKNKAAKYSFLVLIILWTLYSFFIFFTSDIWKEAYSSYQTIFASPYWQ